MAERPGFLTHARMAAPERPAAGRLNDFYEIFLTSDDGELKRQGARCMDCGVPFCQSDAGCPTDNLIPEWNELVHRDRWHDAYERLIATNNFPEFTGRICPAPCESACVLGITDPPVAIKSIECAIIDRAFAEGWVVSRPPVARTGRRVAIVGSGPAGLAAADQLNRAGHHVTVFERSDRVGGLLMYGVPNMKLDKTLVRRRTDLLAAEGVEFIVNANIGVDIDAAQLRRRYDSILLACGALRERDLPLPGRKLAGVHRAMDYLHPVTRSLLDSGCADGRFIDARGLDVVVIGGGDTGADCIGTALRQHCASLLNITRREREPADRGASHPWPWPPGSYTLDYSHHEGVARFGRDPREYGVLPLEFIGDDEGRVRAVRIERITWKRDERGRARMERTGDVTDLPADLVLLAIGFTGHDAPGLARQLGIQYSGGLMAAEYGRFTTSVEGVFAAGDVRRGASLIVWAIAEGRAAAQQMDRYLMRRAQ